MGEHAGLVFHKFRGEFLGIFGHSFKPQAVLFDNGVVVFAGIDKIADQPPCQGTVRAGQRLGKNIGIAGHGVEPGIDHHQVGPMRLGVCKLGHEGRMTDRRVCSKQQDQIRLGIMGKRVPETGDQMVPQKPAIIAG